MTDAFEIYGIWDRSRYGWYLGQDGRPVVGLATYLSDYLVQNPPPNPRSLLLKPFPMQDSIGGPDVEWERFVDYRTVETNLDEALRQDRKRIAAEADRIEFVEKEFSDQVDARNGLARELSREWNVCLKTFQCKFANGHEGECEWRGPMPGLEVPNDD